MDWHCTTTTNRIRAQQGEAAKTYTNPVGETPIHMGDPFVLQHGGRYYLFGTNASNEGFKCWESTDLVHWTPKGWAYQETDDSWAKSHYWAPEVKEYRGKFYMTYSAMPKKAETPRLLIALAVSDKPEGPYKDLHAPWFDFGYSAIDGHIFVDDDGKPYLYFSRNGVQDGYSFGIIYGVALADDLSKPVGEAVKLMEADQPWEKVRYAENRCNEGAFVLKHKGRYYMTYSANHTGFPHYGIGYATADKPLGPWVKAEENPIAATNLEIGVSGPGHNSITRSPDGKEMFIVYHSHADPKKPSGERVVNIDRLQFDEDGKLKIKGPTRSPAADAFWLPVRTNAMAIVRRSLGLGTLLLSILGLTVCLAVIVGVWMVKSRVEAVSDAALEAADQSLAFVDDKLGRVEEILKRGQQPVTLLSTAAERLQRQEPEAKEEVTSLLRQLDDTVFQELKSAQSWLDSAHALR